MALAIYTVCNTCGMQITDINDEYVDIIGFVGDKHHYKLYTNNKGRVYFRYQNGCRYYIDEFMRV